MSAAGIVTDPARPEPLLCVPHAERGIPVTKVSRALGHATPAKTLTVYAHVIREDVEDLRGAFGQQFWAEDPGAA